MQTLSLADFKEKIFNFEGNTDWKFAGSRPAIIDFYADWCGPCRALSPILEQLSKDYEGKVDIYKVDTEAEPELAAMFGIRSIPSLLFVPMQGEPQMATGLLPRETLTKVITDVLKV